MSCFQELMHRFPSLTKCDVAIRQAFDLLVECYRLGGKVLVCGNGGSAADAEHIVGELLNKFNKKRKIDQDVASLLPAEIADGLVGALPAVSLSSMNAALSAIANDSRWDLAFAQQVYGLGRRGDVLMAISTSGNSRNCINAAYVARAKGLRVIAMTGVSGGGLAALADVAICVPEHETFKIQELHLPVYHALCAAIEDAFFPHEC